MKLFLLLTLTTLGTLHSMEAILATRELIKHTHETADKVQAAQHAQQKEIDELTTKVEQLEAELKQRDQVIKDGITRSTKLQEQLTNHSTTNHRH